MTLDQLRDHLSQAQKGLDDVEVDLSSEKAVRQFLETSFDGLLSIMDVQRTDDPVVDSITAAGKWTETLGKIEDARQEGLLSGANQFATRLAKELQVGLNPNESPSAALWVECIGKQLVDRTPVTPAPETEAPDPTEAPKTEAPPPTSPPATSPPDTSWETLQHKGSLKVEIGGRRNVRYLDSLPLLSNQIAIFGDLTTKIRATSPVGVVRYRSSPAGASPRWPQSGDWSEFSAFPSDVSFTGGSWIVDLWIHEPGAHNELEHRDPIRLYFDIRSHLPILSVEQGEFVANVVDFGGQFGIITKTSAPAEVYQPLGLFDIERIKSRSSQPTSRPYGKAFDQIRQSQNSQMARINALFNTGSFAIDAGNTTSLRDGFRFHAVNLAVAFITRGLYLDELRKCLIDNMMRVYPVGLRGWRNPPNPSKLFRTNYGYYRCKPAMGYALAFGLLRDAGVLRQVLSPVDVCRVLQGFELFAETCIDAHRVDGNRTDVDGDNTAMWLGSEDLTLYVISRVYPEHPAANDWRRLVMEDNPARTGALSGIVRDGVLFGLFGDKAVDGGPGISFQDRVVYWNSRELGGDLPYITPMMGLMFHVFLNVARKAGDPIPTHAVQFEVDGAAGKVEGTKKSSGDPQFAPPLHTCFMDPKLAAQKDNWALIPSWAGVAIALSDIDA